MLRRPETKKVAEFLYEFLVSNAPSKDYARKVAEKMNVPYASMARYWQGRAVFPAGLVRSLFLASEQSMRVAELFLLEGSDYHLERQQPGDPHQDLTRAVMTINKLEGEVSGLYLKATHEDSDDGEHISYLEAKNLEEALRRLTRTAEELRVVIKSRHLDTP